MTDQDLNRLMAEAMGWETADPDGVATWWDTKGEFTGYITRKPAYTKHLLWDCPVWQPTVRIEQAMEVLEERLRKRGWTGILFMLLDGYHMELTYRVDGISMDKHIVGPYAKRHAKAICLAIAAAVKHD